MSVETSYYPILLSFGNARMELFESRIHNFANIVGLKISVVTDGGRLFKSELDMVPLLLSRNPKIKKLLILMLPTRTRCPTRLLSVILISILYILN